MAVDLQSVLATLEKQASVIPHAPWPKQREFLALTCREAMIGGAAGGGKSDALLMAALMYWDRPNYGALMMRRTFPELSRRGGLMSRAADWLRPSGARWKESEHAWHFPSAAGPGAILAFGHMETSAARTGYQSSEWDAILIDELTDWLEGDYLYMGHRIRRNVDSSIPPRLRASTTPGGIGHDWVKKRFIDEPEDRVFLPSKATDNPSLDLDTYMHFLNNLPPLERAQKRDGLWIRDDGSLVYKYDDLRNGIDELPPREDYHVFVAFDVGASEKHETTAYCIGCYAKNARETFLVESDAMAGVTQDRLESMLESFRERARAGEWTMGKEARIESLDLDPGGHGRMLIKGLRERGIPVHGAETRGKLAFQSLMNGDFESGRLKVVRGRNLDLIGDWSKIAWSEDRKTDDGRNPDHRADAALYAWRRSYAFSSRLPVASTESADPRERALDALEREAERQGEIDRAARGMVAWDEQIV